jgi:50S ribosomal protein L16 3-hydroxylase
MENFGLASLVSPKTSAEFMSQSWPKKPFVTHGLGQSVQSLTQLPFLASLEAMLNSWPTLVQAHLPDVADESSSVDASPKDARKLFANGMGLLFNNVQNFSPELVSGLNSLRNDLGLPMSTYGRCMVYATPDGKGTAPHFDQNVNFVLQLHGTKKWWLAANDSVENPTQRFTIGQPLDPELGSYVHAELPTAMPSAHQEVILQPGSMLFVPRGYWHSTSAEGEALALNFTFTQPTFVDLFTLALRSRLLLSSEWRELADGVTAAEPARRALAAERFDALLLGLIDDLPNWQAADVLGATEGDFEMG